MSTDTYLNLVNGGFVGKVAKQLGLPQPTPLKRYVPGQPLLDGPVLVLGGDDEIARLLSADWDLDVHRHATPETRYAAVVLGLTGLTHPSELGAPVLELAGVLKRLARGGRVVTVSRAATADDAPAVAAARQGVDGLLRSIAKELRGGATGNGLVLADDVPVTAPSVVGALRFFLSSRSAFVDGQLLAVDSAAGSLPQDWDRPLAGRVAVVTGAARGIGESIADTLARDGATVVAVDVPAAGEQLVAVANRVRGTALQLDVTAPDAGARILEHALQRHGRIDIVVHNAGITRDKLLANMTPGQVGVGARGEHRLAAGDQRGAADLGRLHRRARGSSRSRRPRASRATAGSPTTRRPRAASSAWSARPHPCSRRSAAPRTPWRPGFIETEMTARIPAVTRQVARRLNSLQQGGQPVDVAETVAFLASPAAGGVVGRVLRVCGQNLVGQ